MVRRAKKTSVDPEVAEQLLKELKKIIRGRKLANIVAAVAFLLLIPFLWYLDSEGAFDSNGKRNLAVIRLKDIQNKKPKVPLMGYGKKIDNSNFEAIPIIYVRPGDHWEENLNRVNWSRVQNFLIRNVVTKKETLLFGKPIYVMNVKCNYDYFGHLESPPRGAATYFYFGAADKDTNHDGKIDDEDDGHAYSYRLSDGKISRMNPEGTSVVFFNRPEIGPKLELELLRRKSEGRPESYERWEFDEQNPGDVSWVADSSTLAGLQELRNKGK